MPIKKLIKIICTVVLSLLVIFYFLLELEYTNIKYL